MGLLFRYKTFKLGICFNTRMKSSGSSQSMRLFETSKAEIGRSCSRSQSLLPLVPMEFLLMMSVSSKGKSSRFSMVEIMFSDRFRETSSVFRYKFSIFLGIRSIWRWMLLDQILVQIQAAQFGQLVQIDDVFDAVSLQVEHAQVDVLVEVFDF